MDVDSHVMVNGAVFIFTRSTCVYPVLNIYDAEVAVNLDENVTWGNVNMIRFTLNCEFCNDRGGTLNDFAFVK